MSEQTLQAVACARHRNVSTYLRCGKCGTPICPKCLTHTPVGARCPDCARPARMIRRGSSLVYLTGAGAGLGVGLTVGGMLTLVPGAGAFLLVPLLLGGLLTGEAVSKASRRRGGRSLAIIAFLAAVIGPILGRALVIGLSVSLQNAGQVAFVVSLAVGSFGALGLLLLLLGGVIASTRIDR